MTEVLVKSVDQTMINAYAEASGDKNPIHIDPEFAKSTQFGGTIAHGMLVLAFVQEALVSKLGHDALFGKKLSAKFKAPVRPGDTVSVDLDGDEDCKIRCINQNGEVVLIGNLRKAVI